MAELTHKQQRFVAEFLIDSNATQAAIRAGYSKKTAGRIGSENLQKPDIARAIEERQKKLADENELDAKWVLKNLKNIAERCQQLEPVKEFNYKTKEMEETGEYMFDSAGANKAVELIGKHLGMFKERLCHEDPDGSPAGTGTARALLLAKLTGKPAGK